MFFLYCFLALFLTLGLSPIVFRLSARIGALDRPDGVRKLHGHITPRLGGLAVFSAFSFCALLSFGLGDARTAALVSGGGILAAAGVADDTHGLSPQVKLAFQLAAATCALLTLGAPSAITFLGGVWYLPTLISFVLCLGLFVLLINAVNFIDGVDGLATGVVGVGLLTLALIARGMADDGGAGLCLLLLFCLLGFLPYNLYPAKGFMGDTGSQFLGFAAGVLLVGMPTGTFAPAALFLFAVPIADALFSIVRRAIRARSLFAADRGHLHHRLLERGISPPACTVLMTLFAVCGALIGYGLLLS